MALATTVVKTQPNLLLLLVSMMFTWFSQHLHLNKTQIHNKLGKRTALRASLLETSAGQRNAALDLHGFHEHPGLTQIDATLQKDTTNVFKKKVPIPFRLAIAEDTHKLHLAALAMLRLGISALLNLTVKLGHFS